MSMPALRQPKFLKTAPDNKGKVIKPVLPEQNYVILTLKDGRKLVLSSDAYHGILTVEDMYKCVFCGISMELSRDYKEFHKNSIKHNQAMMSMPYVEEYLASLIRQINKERFYCTICNVIVTLPFLIRHVSSEVHIHELGRASARVTAYTTVN